MVEHLGSSVQLQGRCLESQGSLEVGRSVEWRPACTHMASLFSETSRRGVISSHLGLRNVTVTGTEKGGAERAELRVPQSFQTLKSLCVLGMGKWLWGEGIPGTGHLSFGDNSRTFLL